MRRSRSPRSTPRVVEPGAGSLKGRVVAPFLLGDRTRVVVEGIGAAPIIAEAPARREFTTGDPVYLVLDPGGLLVLDR